MRLHLDDHLLGLFETPAERSSFFLNVRVVWDQATWSLLLKRFFLRVDQRRDFSGNVFDIEGVSTEWLGHLDDSM